MWRWSKGDTDNLSVDNAENYTLNTSKLHDFLETWFFPYISLGRVCDV